MYCVLWISNKLSMYDVWVYVPDNILFCFQPTSFSHIHKGLICLIIIITKKTVNLHSHFSFLVNRCVQWSCRCHWEQLNDDDDWTIKKPNYVRIAKCVIVSYTSDCIYSNLIQHVIETKWSANQRTIIDNH